MSLHLVNVLLKSPVICDNPSLLLCCLFVEETESVICLYSSSFLKAVVSAFLDIDCIKIHQLVQGLFSLLLLL